MRLHPDNASPPIAPDALNSGQPDVGSSALLGRLVAELRKEEALALLRARIHGSLTPAHYHASVICCALADVLERTLRPNDKPDSTANEK